MPHVVVDGKLAMADSEAYYGGTLSDEIGDLVSLELGVRLRLAGTIRLSGIHDAHSPSRQIRFEVPRLARPGLPQQAEIIPRARRRPANIDLLDRIESLPRLSEKAEIELVRAPAAASGTGD